MKKFKYQSPKIKLKKVSLNLFLKKLSYNGEEDLFATYCGQCIYTPDSCWKCTVPKGCDSKSC